MSHQHVLLSLAEHLRDPQKILFLEPNLNGWAMGGTFGSPDVLEIPISYSKFHRKIYEVKYSIGDLRKDLREGKWERYLPICDRMIFALGHGVPHEELNHLPVGIICQRENGTWRTVRAAPKNMAAQPWKDNVWMALLFGKMGIENKSRETRIQEEKRRLESGDLKELRYHRWKSLQDLALQVDNKLTSIEIETKNLEKLRAQSEIEIRQHVLDGISRRITGWYQRGKDEDHLFREWARKTLDRGWQDLRNDLMKESDNGNHERENSTHT